MNRVRLLIFLAIVAVLCAANLLAVQRTFVSAASGNDSNPCSRALPCRNFAAAIPLTDPDGEVLVLDSGGYGVVTINQSVSLISPSGVYAGITAFSGNAVTVNASDTGQVVLRNLSLNSQGADNGIDADTMAALHVESCIITGFTKGIEFFPTTTGARLYVSDTTVRRSSTGIRVNGASLRTTMDSVRLYQNFYAVSIEGGEATIRKSVAAGGSTAFIANYNSKVAIENSVSTANQTGFYAGTGSKMTITRCAATSNTSFGVVAYESGTEIYVSDSTIAANGTGVLANDTAEVKSRGNNTLQENTINGSFSGSFMPN